MTLIEHLPTRKRHSVDTDHHAPSVALVLSSGSSLGAAQIGHLRALAESGIRPDVIIGCSVGAINGVAYAGRPTDDGLAQMEAIWRGLKSSDLFPLLSGRTLARIVSGRDHICSPDPLRELIAGFCGHADLADTEIPVDVATTDLDTSDSRWWQSGPTVDILAASTAIPGLFPPVRLDGHRHVDGGVLIPNPIGRAIELGAEHIFVSDVCGRERREKGAFGTLIEAFNVARYAGARLPVPAAGQHIAVLPSPSMEGISLTDFAQTGRLIDEAHTQTMRWLTQLQDWHLATTAASVAGRRTNLWRRHAHLREPASPRPDSQVHSPGRGADSPAKAGVPKIA